MGACRLAFRAPLPRRLTAFWWTDVGRSLVHKWYFVVGKDFCERLQTRVIISPKAPTADLRSGEIELLQRSAHQSGKVQAWDNGHQQETFTRHTEVAEVGIVRFDLGPRPH